MKFKFFFAVMLFVQTIGFGAEPFKVDPKDILERLEKSGTIYMAQVEATRNYVKQYKMEENTPVVNNFGGPESRLKILTLIYKPKNADPFEGYPLISVDVYFHIPGDFEMTVGNTSVNFYHLETRAEVIKATGPQPGGSSSAGRR